MKLGLGTAQFGLDYGISNQNGKVSTEEARRILERAWSVGVRMIDTAPGYGNSETVLGGILSPQSPFRVVTKTLPLKKQTVTPEDATAMKKTYRESLSRLGLKKAYALLSHHVEDVLVPGGDHLIKALQDLVQEGHVEKVGVSVYTGEQIDEVLKRFTPQVIQLPLNVFDQRLLRSGHLDRLKEKGIEVHARSIFLQGLLLMSPSDLTLFFERVKPHLQMYLSVLKQEHLGPLQAALQFVAERPEIDALVVGVTSLEEWDEILRAWTQPFPALDWSRFAFQDEDILNPARWKVAA